MKPDALDDAALNKVLKWCGTGPDRFDRLADYLAHLKGVWQWSDAELEDLKARVTCLMTYPREAQ